MSRPELSLRERQVLVLLAAGHSAGETGRRLYLSVGTVRTYRSALLRKLRARNGAHAVHLAYQCGLLSAEPGGGP